MLVNKSEDLFVSRKEEAAELSGLLNERGLNKITDQLGFTG